VTRIDTSASGVVRWASVIYFTHFDIARSSTIDVTLNMYGGKVDYVFTIPAE